MMGATTDNMYEKSTPIPVEAEGSHIGTGIPPEVIPAALETQDSLASSSDSVKAAADHGSVSTVIDGGDGDKQFPTSSTSPVDSPASATDPGQQSERPYSAFTGRQRWGIVALASLAAIFGPISSNIFVPAIPYVADSFDISDQKVDLALTIYLVFQALSPSFLSGLSDSLGRRPVLMICLAVYCVACVAIALTPRDSYWLLLLFRCIQAIGGSPALGTGSGAMSDIATPQQRGAYMGLFTGAAMIGPSLGPVLGGVLVEYLSWRWIFWVLAILCTTNLGIIFVFMPETLRARVGDGSLKPPTINARPIDWIRNARPKDSEKQEELDPAALATRTTPPKYNPLSSFRMLLYPEVFLIELFGSLTFAVFFGTLTVYSTILSDDYGYDDIKIGLCYLSQGVGSLVAGVLGGRILDWQFNRMKRQLNFVPKNHRDIDGFPIEVARFRFLPYYLPIYVAAVLGFAWSLEYRASIAISVAMSFIIGLLCQFTMQCCSVCLIDMIPMRAGGVVASYNFLRCLCAAVVSGVITPLIDATNVGWAFVILCAILVASSPGMWLLRRNGPGWRVERKKQFGRGGKH